MARKLNITIITGAGYLRQPTEIVTDLCRLMYSRFFKIKKAHDDLAERGVNGRKPFRSYSGRGGPSSPSGNCERNSRYRREAGAP